MTVKITNPIDAGPAPPVGAGGTGGTSTSVAASGDARIDGLLTGVRWSGSSITYTDPNAAGDYQAGYFTDINGDGTSAQNQGFGQISAGQLQTVHYALNDSTYTQPAGARGFSVEGFTSLGITYGTAGSGSGTMRVANTSDNSYGWTYFPANSIYGGDAWMGTAIQSPAQGNYAWNNTLHELGHGLGLKHGQDGGGPGNTALPSNVDSLEYTVMTYRSYVGAPATGYSNGSWDYPQTYMMLDIAALQKMYGADFTSSATNAGNTVYTWSPTTGQSFVNGTLATNPGGNRIFETIWDGNGTDTYDLSNYTTNQTIDLTPGGYSTFSSAQRAYLGNGHYSRGEVFNALQYNGDARSLIENAKGGSGGDAITGNQAANTLDGGGGVDTMTGDLGGDTYIVDNKDDTVIEAFGGGVDKVLSSSSFTLSNEVENLTLTGSGDNNAVGNTLDNALIGNVGDNVLDGKTGRDTMTGGNGSDTYVIDNAHDKVVELTGQGIDKVVSSVSFSIAAQAIEKVQLSGTGNANVVGNTLNNTISGNAGGNILAAGLGNDTMTGGGGNDNFLFNTALGNNVDHIKDFSVIHDTIRLDHHVFKHLTTGTLKAAAFKDITAPGTQLDANDHILYNHDTGRLYYDADGSGSIAKVQFAILDTDPNNVTNHDFFVV